MHRADANSLRDTAEKFQLFLKQLHDWIRIHGAPESDVKLMMDATAPMMSFIAPAKPDIEVIGGEIIRVGDEFQFQVISTPGHTIGNLCLYEKTRLASIFLGRSHPPDHHTQRVAYASLRRRRSAGRLPELA